MSKEIEMGLINVPNPIIACHSQEPLPRKKWLISKVGNIYQHPEGNNFRLELHKGISFIGIYKGKNAWKLGYATPFCPFVRYTTLKCRL